MRALVIYDMTGRIWNIVYGADTAPQGLTCMYVDIPEGAQLIRIDVTNPEDPQPVYEYLPDSDIGRLQKQVEGLTEELTAAQDAIEAQKTENDMAIAELTLAMASMAGGGGGNV